MHTAYVPKQASHIRSPSPDTEAQDQHATPDDGMAQGSTSAWGMQSWVPEPWDWDDGEGYRWGNCSAGDGETTMWIPGEWGDSSWGSKPSTDGAEGVTDTFDTLAQDFHTALQ